LTVDVVNTGETAIDSESVNLDDAEFAPDTHVNVCDGVERGMAHCHPLTERRSKECNEHARSKEGVGVRKTSSSFYL
jgi:hypothetical protein